MNSQLNELNFNGVLKLSTVAADYDFNTYLQLGQHPIHGFCTLCEQKGCNTCPGNSSFTLQTMSHGATTADLWAATETNAADCIDWKKDSVLFLMEGPSADLGFYEAMNWDGYHKKPTREWYWLHQRQDPSVYPTHFKGGTYGELFKSVVFTFKLQNAYVTNLVKCGLNNTENAYKGIQEYDWNTLETCFENYLFKELEIMRPKIVFCFGSSVENTLSELYPGDFPFIVCSLPHPAGQRRGLKDDYFRHLYFTRILEGLFKAEIVSLQEAEHLFGMFLTTLPVDEIIAE